MSGHTPWAAIRRGPKPARADDDLGDECDNPDCKPCPDCIGNVVAFEGTVEELIAHLFGTTTEAGGPSYTV